MSSIDHQKKSHKTLKEYKELDNKGFVYNLQKLEGQLSARELLYEYLSEQRENGEPDIISLDDLKELLDFKPIKTEDGVLKTHLQIKLQTKFLKFSAYLAKTYKDINKGVASPRVKHEITHKDITEKSASSMQNIYPKSFICFVKIYIELNPLNLWHINSHDREGFTSINSKISLCVCCNQELNKKSIISHCKTKKHLANS
jgi:hypothetical protein